MIASATPLLPFIPRNIDQRSREPAGTDASLPSDRPYALSTQARAVERSPTPDAIPARSAPVRSVVRFPDAPPATFVAAPANGMQGLMSGRGLY
jgi:hypothetical protein